MSEKITGYLLLVLGVVIILLCAVNVYMVFMGQANPVPIITSNSMIINIPVPSETGKPVNIPLDLGQSFPLARVSNIFFHVMLMGFMVTIGFRLASLGTNLVRPIVIKSN